MSTACFIRAHINSLEPTAIFTTRDLVGYGKRNAVDQVMCRLVQQQFIYRLARGVFSRTDIRSHVTVLEIAAAKARAFGKAIVTHGAAAGNVLGLSVSRSEGVRYAVDGGSSRFHVGETLVTLTRISQRKLKLGETKVGLSLKALWELGQTQFTGCSKDKAISQFGRTDYDELVLKRPLIPDWLGQQFTGIVGRTIRVRAACAERC